MATDFLNECPMFNFRWFECDQTVGLSNYQALEFICCNYFARWKMKYVRCSATIWMHSRIILTKPLSSYTIPENRMKNENSQNHCMQNPYVLMDSTFNPGRHIPHWMGWFHYYLSMFENCRLIKQKHEEWGKGFDDWTKEIKWKVWTKTNSHLKHNKPFLSIRVHV